MAYDVSRIRKPDDDLSKVRSVYDANANMFSLKIHHGGVFVGFPERRYVNGQEAYIDLIDIDTFSVLELSSFMKELGYTHGRLMFYHFRVPNNDLDYGLRALACEEDVISLSKHVGELKLINVYIEHDLTRLNIKFTSPFVAELDKDFDPFLGLDDITGNQNLGKVMDDDCVTRITDKGKEKMVDDCVTTKANKGNKRVVEDGENSNDSDDSQDSDFMVDKENTVDEVEVDMQNYYINIDPQVEFPGCSSHSAISNEAKDVDKYVEVIDNDSFDSSESDEGDDKRKRKLKELRKNNTCDDNLNEIPFFCGQRFESSNKVKLLVKKHSLETRRELKLVKNDKERVRATCFGTIPVFSDGPNDGGPSNIGCSSIVPINIGCSSIEPVNTVAKPSGKKQKKEGTGRVFKDKPQGNQCPWTLHVSKLKEDETWVVKTFNDVHKCLQQRNVKAATAGFLSQQIIDQVEGNPEIPVKAIQDQLQKKYHLDVSKMKAFRAKSKAYAHVRDGFRAGMRDLLGLDGAFMKGPFPGQVLAAVAEEAPENGRRRVRLELK
nr:hypothetical protein [Tanacetum cinerariifolium]